MKDKTLKCSECICLTCIADCDRALCKGYQGDVESNIEQQAIGICHTSECPMYIGDKTIYGNEVL